MSLEKDLEEEAKRIQVELDEWIKKHPESSPGDSIDCEIVLTTIPAVQVAVNIAHGAAKEVPMTESDWAILEKLKFKYDNDHIWAIVAVLKATEDGYGKYSDIRSSVEGLDSHLMDAVAGLKARLKNHPEWGMEIYWTRDNGSGKQVRERFHHKADFLRIVKVAPK